MAELHVRPVSGIGEVRPGDDLAALITGAAPWLADGDVLVVTSKVVSKAEGRLVAVPSEEGPARDAARQAALTAETARVVASRGITRIVQTHHGFVLAAAGIDTSNVDPSWLVLLPEDPDASARRLREALRARHGLEVAVVITDTMGRPWRIGLVDVAVGAAGIEPLADYRGARDRYGNELRLTQTAVLDELAAAAELVKGKTDQVPVAVVRGFGGVTASDGPGARAYVRPSEADLFSLGTAEARADGLRRAATLADAVAFDGSTVDIPGTLGDGLWPVDDPVRDKLVPLLPAGTAAVLVAHAPAGDLGAAAEVGAAVHRLRAALTAEGLATAWVRATDPSIVDVVGLPAERVMLGLLAIGGQLPS